MNAATDAAGAVGRSAPDAGVQGSPIVTTIDLLKLVAVVLMVTDHLGLYFLDGNGWRIAGRPVAPIFGFLIGFSGATRVPFGWIAMGLALTVLGERLDSDGERPPLDVLVTLALTRLAMPVLDSLHRSNPLLLIVAAAVLAGITQSIEGYIDYGAEIAVAALVGVAVRLSKGRATERAATAGTALVATVIMSLLAIKTLDLAGAEAWIAIAVIAATFALLASFRRMDMTRVPPVLAPTLRWIGHNTLAIYAVHLALFQLLAFIISAGAT